MATRKRGKAAVKIAIAMTSGQFDTAACLFREVARVKEEDRKRNHGARKNVTVYLRCEDVTQETMPKWRKHGARTNR